MRCTSRERSYRRDSEAEKAQGKAKGTSCSGMSDKKLLETEQVFEYGINNKGCPRNCVPYANDFSEINFKRSQHVTVKVVLGIAREMFLCTRISNK